jgi:hypothetical protein
VKFIHVKEDPHRHAPHRRFENQRPELVCQSVPDSMAAILLRRLGLPEAIETEVTKDKEVAAAVSNDEGLE